MKRFLTIILIALSMISVSALTNKQTIVLVSVVERELPSFSLNGYADNGVVLGNNTNELRVVSSDISNDTNAHFDIVQNNISRGRARVNLTVSVTELMNDKYSTKGMSITSSSNGVVDGHNVNYSFNYDGVVMNGIVGSVDVHYNGNANLPEGEYVSYVRLAYSVN